MKPVFIGLSPDGHNEIFFNLHQFSTFGTEEVQGIWGVYGLYIRAQGEYEKILFRDGFSDGGEAQRWLRAHLKKWGADVFTKDI
jgi:hypothetical protein